MDKLDNSKEKTRRDFLEKIYALSAAFISEEKLIEAVSEEPKKIKALTPEGKLVEVNYPTLENNQPKQKISNKELLEWMKSNQIKPGK